MIRVGLVEEWEERGRLIEAGGRNIFVVDLPGDVERGEPLLLLHGFPTSCFDWRHIIDALARDRRVVTFDFLGFGLSEKPSTVRYSLFDQATIAEDVMRALGIDRAAVASHDMGDSVAAELYARALDGTLAFDVTRRILTNGSIYIDMAHLSPGQQMLLAMADEALPPGVAPTEETFVASLASIFGETPADPDELHAQWELLSRRSGQTLLPRTIRYIEERRVHEGRWINGLRAHASPITVVWGDEDPIAVYAMAARFCDERPDTRLVRLRGVGHFPMLEAPGQLYEAMQIALSESV
jgi:pimeloyl-ACP methyl ester carboxylesterase